MGVYGTKFCQFDWTNGTMVGDGVVKEDPQCDYWRFNRQDSKCRFLSTKYHRNDKLVYGTKFCQFDWTNGTMVGDGVVKVDPVCQMEKNVRLALTVSLVPAVSAWEKCRDICNLDSACQYFRYNKKWNGCRLLAPDYHYNQNRVSGASNCV